MIGHERRPPAAKVCQLFLSLGHLLVVLHLPPIYDQYKVSATANCGSDLPLYGGLMPTMDSGDVLGHEFMGEVMEAR